MTRYQQREIAERVAAASHRFVTTGANRVSDELNSLYGSVLDDCDDFTSNLEDRIDDKDYDGLEMDVETMLSDIASDIRRASEALEQADPNEFLEWDYNAFYDALIAELPAAGYVIVPKETK